MRKIWLVAISLIVLLLLALAFYPDDLKGQTNMVRMPRIVGDTWFNSKPLTSGDLAGKVVLVDFWTYTCVNCQRTLPYLRRWWERYKDQGLIIIGVHAPEFEFEKDPQNVAQALVDLGVDWPVVLDSDHINWNAFANRYWPAKYLADKEGRIVYWHFGEGEYAETERAIQSLIRDRSGEVTLPDVALDEHAHGAVCFVPTPETYCGYLRGRLGNPGGYRYDAVADYRAPDALHPDSIALSGKFLVKPEYIESAENGTALLLHFHATEVNLVLRPGEESAKVSIALDGKSVPESIRGRDVGPSGEVEIGRAAMYNLVKSDHLVQGTLSIRSEQGQFQAYAFTFSGCEEEPPPKP